MAFVRLAQKIYEPEALEYHFGHFDFTWESRFSAHELAIGRELYRKAAVRILELHKKIAIASLKLDDATEPYCVIDFEESHFSVRSLNESDRSNAPYAVACLYEIEELISDEVLPLAPEKTESEENAVFEEKIEPQKKPEPSMTLLLDFKIKRDALVFASYWKTKNGLMPAFGKASLNANSLKPAEREKLVRIASFARKAGFSFANKSYQCGDTSKISMFINRTIKDWAKYFEIQKSDDLKLISKGVREISIKTDLDMLSDGALFSDIYAELDGERINFSELKHLKGRGGGACILQKRGLVRISEKDDSMLTSAEHMLSDFGGRLPKYMMFTLFEEGLRARVSDSLKEWKEKIFAVRTLPENLNFLREYQRIGVSRMLSLFEGECGILLADEMGLGKTVQTLSVINHFWNGENAFLIVCPASVIPVWIKETEKFFPEMSCETFDSFSDLNAPNGGKIWLASYTQLRRNKHKLEGKKFKLAVLDEAQFIKNPEAKVTEACMAINTEHKIALSGTPMENRLLDVWTIFRWVMPGLMGRRSDFQRKLDTEPDFLAKIKRQIAPFILRRLKDEVAKELPAKNILDLPCLLTPMQSAEYSKLLESAQGLAMGGGVENKSGRFSILALLTRLRQVACDPALLPWMSDADLANSGKISALCDMMPSIISNGRKAVIFSQFTSFIDRMQAKLKADYPELNIAKLTGDTIDRAEPVAQFQNSSGAAVIFVSLRAGGTGITLTAADYVFIADPWWNPAVENQAIDRVHRIGKKSEVIVYRLIAEGTVEERVRKLQQSKSMLFSDIFGELASGGKNFEQSIKEILDI